MKAQTENGSLCLHNIQATVDHIWVSRLRVTTRNGIVSTNVLSFTEVQWLSVLTALARPLPGQNKT